MNKLINWLFGKIAGVQMHHCYLCGLYRFGTWVEAKYVTVEDYCACHGKRPKTKYLWLCLVCRERTFSINN